MAYSNEPAQEEMAISSPFKICRLQASYIIPRKPEHLQAFQMFFPKNTAAEISWDIQQSYNKYPKAMEYQVFLGKAEELNRI